MNILITEHQYKKILKEYEDEQYFYDFFDIKMEKINYILTSILYKKKIKFKLINPVQYKNALTEFVKYGRFVRFPEKYIHYWKNIMVGNTAQLEALNELFGSSNVGFPHDEFYDIFNIPKNERNYDFNEDYTKLDDVYKMDNYIPYFSNGQPVMSDYGLRPLENLCKPLLKTQNPEEIIVIINKMLDISHQRSDLCEIFIQGGTKSLDYISYDEVLNKEIN